MQTESSQSLTEEKLKAGWILNQQHSVRILACLTTKHNQSQHTHTYVVVTPVMTPETVCVLVSVCHSSRRDSVFPCRTRPGEITIVIYSLLCCHGDRVHMCACGLCVYEGVGQGPLLRDHYQCIDIHLWFGLLSSKMCEWVIGHHLSVLLPGGQTRH